MKRAATSKTTKSKPLTHEQKELRRIRTELGLSQLQMADRLGIKLPTFQAYEYGKTLSVNEEVMDRARRLLKETDVSYLHAMFKGRSMKNIVGDWSTRLGIPKGNITELANMMGIDKSTISRWYSAEKRVNVNQWELLRYESIVARLETMLKRQKKAVARLH